jgi:site-specific DNA recombinase
MRVALYARVSTKGQVDGYSLRDQLRALRQHCQQQGYRIVEEIEDKGYSGAYLERPGMDRARDLIAAERVDMVLSQDADRITREPGDRATLDLEAERHSCKWVALDDWGDGSHEGQLLKFLKGWMAKGERRKTAERMQRGKRQRAREGKIVPAGRPPYGFSYDPVAANYRINEEDMRVVRRIFQMAANGTSLHRIRKTFEGEGLTTAGSTRRPEGSRFWNVNSLRRVIRNDVYRSHSFDEITQLVAPEVAAKLDPDKSYGISWYNRHATDAPSGKRRKGEEKPREEWIAVPVPLDDPIPREQVDAARANLKGARASRADDRFWELSGLVFCECGCKLISKVTHKDGQRYHYYVCSRYVRDGREACSHGKWMNAGNLEGMVYHALQGISPQDLQAQIQQQIDKERAPAAEINAEHEVLEDVARQRAKYQQMAARDLITLDELEVHITGLDQRKTAAERRLEALQNSGERVERLRLMQRNPILRFVAQTREQRRDYYKDLELRATTSGGEVKVCGVFGSQNVAPTLDVGDEEVEAAIEVAAGLSAGALERSR